MLVFRHPDFCFWNKKAQLSDFSWPSAELDVIVLCGSCAFPLDLNEVFYLCLPPLLLFFGSSNPIVLGASDFLGEGILSAEGWMEVICPDELAHCCSASCWINLFSNKLNLLLNKSYDCFLLFPPDQTWILSISTVKNKSGMLWKGLIWRSV